MNNAIDYAKLRPIAFKSAQRITGNSAAAEDLTQDTLVKIRENEHRFNPVRGTIESWMIRIMTRLWIDQKRRQHLKVESLDAKLNSAGLGDPSEHDLSFEPVYAGESPGDAMLRSDLSRRIENLVKKAVPSHAEAFLLVHGNGLNYDEAAQVLGLPVGTVRSKVHRASTKLNLIVNRDPSILAGYRPESARPRPRLTLVQGGLSEAQEMAVAA